MQQLQVNIVILLYISLLAQSSTVSSSSFDPSAISTANPLVPSQSPSLFPQPQPPFFCNQPFSTPPLPFPSLPRPNLLSPASRPLLVQTAYNFSMWVDTFDSTVSKSIANTGTWEPEYIKLIGRLVKEGDTVLNVGAQTGLEAVVMGKLVGARGRMFVVEPYSFSYGLLVRNIQLNNLQGISQLYQYGASDEQSTGILKVKIGNTGASQIHPLSLSSTPSPSLTSKSSNLLQYQQQVKLSKLDLLLPKTTVLNFALIDVEGMEIKVLKGMMEIIERSPQLVLMVQWQYLGNTGVDRESAQEILDYFVNKGYRVYSYVAKIGAKGSCELGRFREFKKLQTLFHIKMADLFFFPKDHPLPQSP